MYGYNIRIRQYLRLAIVILALVFVSCCGDGKPPVKEYNQFLKSETSGINLDSKMLLDMMLWGKVVDKDDDVIVFGHNRLSQIYAYRISTDSLMQIGVTDYKRSYCTALNAMQEDSIWYIHDVQAYENGPIGALCNTKSGKLFFPKSALPFYGYHYMIVAHYFLPNRGNHFYTELLSAESLPVATLEEKAYCHRPKLAEWRIEGDSLELVRLFCQYPDEYPANEYEDYLPNIYYNSFDSLILLSSGDSRVWLYDMEGNSLGERRMGSQFEKPKEPFPISQGSYNNALNWYANNNHYGQLIYDPYRNVYLRVMTIPAVEDEEALERNNVETWVLVVADKEFHVKYEVKFDDNKYEWRLILPTEKGVYIAKKKGDKYEEPSLFIFD